MNNSAPLLFYFFLVFFLITSCGSKNKTNQGDYQNVYKSIDTIDVQERLTMIMGSKEYQQIDSILLKTIKRKSSLFDEHKKFDSVFKYDRLLLKIAEERKNIEYMAKGAAYLGYDFREAQTFDSAFFYYQKAKNNYLVLNDSIQVGRKLLNMGQLQYRLNDFFGAKESVTEALQFFEAVEKQDYTARCWNTLGNCYSSLDDFEKAKSSYEIAIHLEQGIDDRAIYMNNLAVLNSKYGNLEKAVNILEATLEELNDDFNRNEYARLVHNLAEIRWKQNKSDVLGIYKEAVEIRKKGNDKWGLLSSYLSLANYYEENTKVTAKKYLDSLIRMSRAVKAPLSEIEALKVLCRLEPNSISYRNRYIFLKDSLYQQELKVKTQFAKMRYDDQQEKDKILRLEKESVKREVELGKEKNKKVLAASFGFFLLLGSFLIIYFFKTKHKKELLDRVYATEKRISKKVHDVLANDVYTVMSALEHGNDNPPTELLDKLEHIYERTRDISHENREIALGATFATDIKEMLGTFNSVQTNVILKGFQDIDWAKIPPHTCITLHRVCKELMVNMKKHSKASTVILSFSEIKKWLITEYVDNGIGCPTTTKFGVGLQSTENRIQSIGGRFIFDTSGTKGLKVTIKVPL